MQLIRYVTAYVALSVLAKKEMPFQTAYRIAGVKRNLAPKAEFYSEKERELVEKYAKRDENGKVVLRGGSFDCKGDTPEEISRNAREYERARRELGEVEDGEAVEAVAVTLPEDVRISPEAIEALRGFIEFEVI